MIYIDIDMVVANNLERIISSLDSNKKILKESFFLSDRVMADKLIAGSVEAIRLIRKNNKIVYLTVRPIIIREVTKNWLVNMNLLEENDSIVFVEDQMEKVKHIAKDTNSRVLLIDDMRYDYQSGIPKLNLEFILEMDKQKLRYIIFSDWKNTILKLKEIHGIL